MTGIFGAPCVAAVQYYVAIHRRQKKDETILDKQVFARYSPCRGWGHRIRPEVRKILSENHRNSTSKDQTLEEILIIKRKCHPKFYTRRWFLVETLKYETENVVFIMIKIPSSPCPEIDWRAIKDVPMQSSSVRRSLAEINADLVNNQCFNYHNRFLVILCKI